MLRRSMLALVPLLMAAQTTPPPPWADARGDLDGDGKPERAHLERDGALVVDGSDGREWARVMLPDARRIERAQLRFATVEDHVVVHVKAEIGRGQADEAVVAGGGKTLFLGRTGPVGDGDRLERLRVDEAGIVRYQTSPGFVRCDGEDELFPERWDFASGRFRAVTVEPPAGKPLRSATVAPDGIKGPPLGLFRFVAASTDDTGERRADRLAAPHELEDGAPATLWHAGNGATARGAWATARAQAGAQKIHALEIIGGATAPRTLTLILGPEQRFTVDVATGARWVTLPDTAPTACLSIVVNEPNAKDNTLGEVAIYTDIDGPAGLQQLVEQVAGDKPEADGAAHLLMTRGHDAAAKVAELLPLAHGPGKRRLLQVLAAIADPTTATALGTALETAGANERPLVIEALAKLGDAGVAPAARIFADESQTGEARADAATVLGLAGGATAFAALTAGAGHGDGGVRAASMQALTRRFGSNPAAVFAALGKVAGHDDDATGDLARVIGRAAAQSTARDDAAAALIAAWSATAPTHFAARLRLLRALGDLGHAAALPTVSEAAHDADPILRATAVSAAARLDGGAAIAKAAVADADPGVRKAAVMALGGRPEGVAESEAALGNDAWPMVRHAAADALGAACAASRGPASPALARALAGDGKELHGADRSEEVRRAALFALGRCAAPLPLLTTTLDERQQPVSVRELAAALVARRGGPVAAKALASALDDTLGDPAGDEQSMGLAIACTHALARTGDTSRPVLEALGEAANEPASAPLRAAAMETIGLLCPDGAAVALDKGAKDPDGNVNRAARRARERCHK
ncbi:MAG TPA: hypothetical protein VIA18_12655 [Polyangia bacterium]|nr:hypothetical protein [Polyangia bacterium]